MRHSLLLVAAAAVLLPAVAGAAPIPGTRTTELIRTGKTIDKITCRDFTATEDKFKPETLSYAIGYGKHGHAKDAVVDVGGIQKMVPVVVQACLVKPDNTLLAQLETMQK